MNNIKSRKYARTIKKYPDSQSQDETEFSLSSTCALGILGGAFLLGLAAGHFWKRRD